MERCAGKTTSVNKPDRKKIEQDRRKQMKDLCSKMVSIIPDHHFSPPKVCVSEVSFILSARDKLTSHSPRVSFSDLLVKRIQMKDLCSKLVSIIPNHHFNPPKEYLSQVDQIEQATRYIKILSERIEELRREKELALANKNRVRKGGLQSSMVKVQDLGSNLEIVLISGIRKKHFILSKVISIVEEEGAEVVTVSLSNIGDKILHTVHAKVKVSRVGVDTASIRERLQDSISPLA